MTMVSVAKEFGLHESTVSRAVQNKFILCSFGTVNMKSFFTRRIAADNESSSQRKVYLYELLKT